MNLGTRFQLLAGDCLEELKRLPDGSVDLTVTSPPYDSLRTYNNSSPFTFDAFKVVAAELARVTKQGGVIVWVVGDQTIDGSETGTSFRQALYFKDELEMNIHDTMIYHKDACPFPETNRYYPLFEYMFVFSKGKPKIVNLIKDKPNKRAGSKITATQRNPDGQTVPVNCRARGLDRLVKAFGVRGNVWLYSPGKNKSTLFQEAYKHPAIFPEKLAEDHILSWSNPGDTVLDPFLGSGTTGAMALKHGRKFIGIEREPTYMSIAEKRIEHALSQETLFTEKRMKEGKDV